MIRQGNDIMLSHQTAPWPMEELFIEGEKWALMVV